MSAAASQTSALAPLLEVVRAHQGRRAIPAPYLMLLTVLAVLPLALVALRVLAVSGMAPNALGSWLDQHLSLLAIPAVDRAAVLHVVQLPLAALLVALTRLTLGIRVLGFRAILIAIGMREVGILPSLALIAIIAASVVVVRPLMRRSGMPLYARVSSILAMVAATMVAGLLLGTAFDSALLSSFAFFPVVILAMLAESIADTVARESGAMAAWRTGSTIVLALLIALLCEWSPLRELTLACPELILTQLVLVVLVSEFLDFRLLEDFRPSFGGEGAEATSGMHIAVVRNRWNTSVLRHTGPAAPQRYRLRSVQGLVDALRAAGHTVAVIEADARLYSRLQEFFPRSALGDSSRGLVINCAGGVQGRGRLTQVPSLCEMIGVPCTGPDALAMATISDRLMQRRVLAECAIPTPEFRAATIQDGELADDPNREQGPWLLAHRFQSDRDMVLARNRTELRRAVERIVGSGDQPLFASEAGGRRLRVYVLEGRRASVADVRRSLRRPGILPPLERRGPAAALRPAALSSAQQQAVAETALRAFTALGCRDMVRVDLWIDGDDRVGVLQLRPIEIPTPGGAAARAARAAGLSFNELLEEAYGIGLQANSSDTTRVASTPITPAIP
ncbi:MAG: 7TM domain-containing protein [Halieaceae bacterium]|jgi:D-alanine-D-alanine ligase-like ATP-grasp enzyme|nr:7TM domain-containing protein [Halieaceae bacterium]